MPYNIEHFNINNITAHLTGLTTEDELDINIVEPDLVSEAIRKTPQILSENEKKQARQNIGAVSQEIQNDINNIYKEIGNYEFSLSFTGNQRKYIYGDFKTGDVFQFNIRNYTLTGTTGQHNIAILNDSNDYLKVLSNNGSAYITLTKDTSYLHIAIGLTGYSDMSVDVQIIMNISYDIYNINNSITNLSDKIESVNLNNNKISFQLSGNDINRKYIYGDFKTGDIITISVSDYTVYGTSGTDTLNVLNDSDEYLCIFTKDDIKTITLTKATSYIHIALGFTGYDNMTVTVDVNYDNSYINILKNNVYNENKIKFIDYEYDNSLLNRWVYGEYNVKTYYGIKKTYNDSIYINNIEFLLFSDNYNYTGEEVEIIIGTIDQRNWLLPVNKITTIIKQTPYKNKYYVNDFDLYVDKGQVVFIGLTCKDSTTLATFAGYYSGSSISDNETLYYTHDITSSLQKLTDTYPFWFIINGYEVQTKFILNENIDNIEDKIKTHESLIENKQDSILIDKITGDKYKLIVKNGVLSIKNIIYSNILYIGNSFSGYAWYDNRAMAATTPQTTYEELIKTQIGGSYTVISGVGFERDSANFDLNTWNLTDVYDCVVIQLGENGVYNDTLLEDCERMYNFVKSHCISADVYSIIPGYYNTQVRNSFINGAINANIPVYDIANVAMQDRHWDLGDYVLNENGEYTYLDNSGVTQGHPSDIGMYNIANSLLEKWGYDIITNRKYNININQTSGGFVSLICPYWISDGIVSVRTSSNDGYTPDKLTVITDNNVNIESVKRENTYGVFFTFIMPSDNVTITPSWTSIQ